MIYMSNIEIDKQSETEAKQLINDIKLEETPPGPIGTTVAYEDDHVQVLHKISLQPNGGWKDTYCCCKKI